MEQLSSRPGITVDALKQCNSEEIIKDYFDCLAGDCIISIDECDIESLEGKISKSDRAVEVRTLDVKSVEEGKERIVELFRHTDSRDCILMLSGDVTIESFGGIISNIDMTIGDANVVFALKNKKTQGITMTCIAY